jgi:hypothetical protein
LFSINTWKYNKNYTKLNGLRRGKFGKEGGKRKRWVD